MDLMLRGQAMADTILPDTRLQCSEQKSLVPTMATTQKRHSKQQATQSRMVQQLNQDGDKPQPCRSLLPQWTFIKGNAQKAFSGITRVTALSSCIAINLGRYFHPFTTKHNVIKGGLNQEMKNISPLFLTASYPKKQFRRCC